MRVTMYQAEGGKSAFLNGEGFVGTVLIQAQADHHGVVSWPSELQAPAAIKQFEQLLGNVALGPDTALAAKNSDASAASDLAAMRGLVELSEDVLGMRLDIGDERILNWSPVTFESDESCAVSFGFARSAPDFALLSRLLETTGSPGIVRHTQEIEDQAQALLA
jgi:hypothetical protein